MSSIDIAATAVPALGSQVVTVSTERYESPLLSLPAEIRVDLYKELFKNVEVRLRYQQNRDNTSQPSIISILCVCKLLRCEATPVFHHNATFVAHDFNFGRARSDAGILNTALFRKIVIEGTWWLESHVLFPRSAFPCLESIVWLQEIDDVPMLTLRLSRRDLVESPNARMSVLQTLLATTAGNLKSFGGGHAHLVVKTSEDAGHLQANVKAIVFFSVEVRHRRAATDPVIVDFRVDVFKRQVESRVEGEWEAISLDYWN